MGNIKRNNVPIFDKNRENEVIEKNVGYLKNKNYIEETRRFFTTLMETARELESRKVEKRLLKINDTRHKVLSKDKIGFYGVNGSFTEEAMIKYFGENKKPKAYEEFEDVFCSS